MPFQIRSVATIIVHFSLSSCRRIVHYSIIRYSNNSRPEIFKEYRDTSSSQRRPHLPPLTF